MRKGLVWVVLCLATLATAACSGGRTFSPSLSTGAAGSGDGAASAKHSKKPDFTIICLASGSILCPYPTAPPSPPASMGLSATQLEKAYGTADPNPSASPTVAVLELGGDATVNRDLAVYREEYGLSECQEYFGCLTVVDMNGGQNLPTVDNTLETSTDVDMVSAMCPYCKILVVELPGATSDIDTLLTQTETAVKTAASLGAVVASASYGDMESTSVTAATMQTHAANFAALPIPVVASAGDWGYDSSYRSGYPVAPQVPADIPTVIAVGGTELTSISPRAENAWYDTADGEASGGGCSLFFAAPSFQASYTKCAGQMRETPDISFDAAYVAVFANGAFTSIEGTSIGAPAIAAYMSSDASTSSLGWIYSNFASAREPFYDVTGGHATGNCASSPANLCSPGPGFDGSTGVGSPDSIFDFQEPLPIICCSPIKVGARHRGK
ncbi:MAG TPA: hypothetical protein VMH02_04620 [Verrucomicrobiae bacterium]|nr:hypothetical protein [Verrucomicrobiae bacterium]